MNPSAAGRAGEDTAARYLEEAGWRIITRNYRTRRGEIDIIALDGEVLVFVEVKSWQVFGFEDLGLALDRRKRRRIIETAKSFVLANREYNDAALRFDCLFLGPDGPRHLASAFTESV